MGGHNLDGAGAEVDSIDRAIATLEAQRAVLGDAVVETAIAPLLEKRAALVPGFAGEQRKLVTVLFADLVDFTVLSQELDAEDVRSVVNAYFVRWHAQIEANGGVVEKFVGDAVMAVFGLDRAHEDDPQRAIRAGLAMKAALHELNGELAPDYGVTLTMRVGIDTGEVVVSTLDDRPGQDMVVVGETVNRASRLQSAAPPGEIVISLDTHRHVRGEFGFESMGGLRLKGIPEPVEAFRVLTERPRTFRLDGSRGVEGVDTRTIGRDIELRQLQAHFGEVVDEQRWRVVTIVGDAGVGKSRLLAEFDRWLAEMPEPVWWFRGRAAPSDSDRPNALLRDVIASRLEIQESDGPDVVREKWEQGLERVLGPGEMTLRKAHVVARWLGFDLGRSEFSPPSGQEPRGLRDRAVAHMAECFERLSEESPVVVLLEDLHWADDSSLAWFDAADPFVHSTRVLVVATARPALLEGHPHWGEGLDFHARLDLRSLSRRESRRLLGEILQKVDDVPESLSDLVVAAAEGNPFHIEELVKWLLDSGVITKDGETWHVEGHRVERARIPPTLRGVLQARIDALSPPERATLQRAAVVGRIFWEEAVDNLARDPAPASGAASTAEALDQMRAREVVYEREHSAFNETREFFFKHALLRDVTYESVLKAHRRTYHRLVAQWLERTAERSRRTDQYAGLIAAHYDEAADDPAAARWYLRAGQQATDVHALQEAGRVLARGLDLAPSTEVDLQFDLHLALEAVHERLGDRDRQQADLAKLDRLEPEIEDPSRRVHLLLARGRWAFNASDYRTQVKVDRQAVEVAHDAGLVDAEVEARLWCGKGLTWNGQHEVARQALEEALEGARAIRHPWLIGESLRNLAIVAGNQGDFGRAVELLEEARAVHREADDPEGEGLVLAQTASVFYNQGRYREARTCIEESLPIFRASGYKYRQAVATTNLGTIVLTEGEFGAARRLVTEGLQLSSEIRDAEGTGVAEGVLGDIYRRAGDLDRAEQHLQQSLEIATEIDYALLSSDSLLNLVLVACERGDLGNAQRLATECVEQARRAGSAFAEARALLGQGIALSAAGRFEEGEAALESSIARAEEVEVASLVLEARAGLALAAFRRGALDEAATRVDELVDHLDVQNIQGCLQPGEVYRTCWRVLLARGDPRTTTVLRDAGRYLDTVSARIDEDDLRESFLDRVPVNAELGDARRSLTL